MDMNREDAFCPACPNPEKAFRIEDVGMKFETEGDMRYDDAVTVKVSRPAWEAVMIEHLKWTDDEAHQRLHAQCVAALILAGDTPAEAARRQVDGVTRSLCGMLDDALQPRDPDILDLRPQLYAGMPRQIEALSPWTERINALNRRVREEGQ